MGREIKQSAYRNAALTDPKNAWNDPVMVVLLGHSPPSFSDRKKPRLVERMKEQAFYQISGRTTTNKEKSMVIEPALPKQPAFRYLPRRSSRTEPWAL